MAQGKLDKLLNSFNSLTENPVKYLTVQNDIKEDIKKLVKELYDFMKTQEQRSKVKSGQALQEIIVKDFDEEQIWQQIELQNSQCWDQLMWDVANSVSNTKDLTFSISFPEEKKSDVMDVEEENSLDEEALLSDAEEELLEQESNIESKNNEVNESVMPKSKGKKTISLNQTNLNQKVSKPKGKPSIVDDQFFKLQDMESFLLKEEKLEGKSKNTESDEDSIDMFEDLDSEGTEEDGGKEMMYSDFFNENNDGIDENDEAAENDNSDIENGYASENDENFELEDGSKKREKKVRFAQPESDDSESEDSTDVPGTSVNGKLEKDEKKSEFELRQQRLKQQISKLEEKTLKEAPWQLKGEIVASKRPQNSLLEEVLDFDLTTRPPPVITEETTVTLEGLIMQRIKDKAWDDVIKKEKPVDDQLLFKKPEVLDQSKSKLSLAQVYESEYLKQKQAASGQIEEEKEPESHKEIREAMSMLFSKLDALCHYHYTPKPPQAEVKIVSNTPAISMEEVAPVATSDAALLAPEEIKRKRKGDLMNKEERSQTDKNRERRKKKKLQRKKGQVEKVTEHRNTSKGVETNDKSLKTSKAFFQQLTDNATSLIKQSKNKG